MTKGEDKSKVVALKSRKTKKSAALIKANVEATTFAVIADELAAKKTREGLVPASLQKTHWPLEYARPTLDFVSLTPS
ncbi:MAG: hypothetical protein ACT4O2_10790 [Beijerinckiaceae bacterium]